LNEKDRAPHVDPSQAPPTEPGDGLHLLALHGVKWATVANWSAQVTGLVTMLVLARLLLPPEFGVYSIGSAMVMIMAGLSQVGLPLALVQRQQIDDGHLDASFWAVTGLAAALLAASFVLRNTIAEVFGVPQLGWLVPVLALSLPLSAVAGIFNAPLMRSLDFRRAGIATSVGAIAGAVVAIALAVGGFGVWSLAAQTLVAAMATLALLIAFSPYRPGWRFSSQRLGELWSFGSRSMAADFVALIDQRSASLLLGALLGPRATGLYAMARRVIDMGQQAFVGSIGQVAMPAFSRIASQPARMRTAYLNAIQSVAALTLPLFGLLAILAREVVVVFLGPAWFDGTVVLRFIAMAALVQPFGWITISALAAHGHAGLRLGLQSLSLVLTVVALVATWRYGLTAVAQGLVVKAAVMHVVLLEAAVRTLPISRREYLRTIGPVAVVAGVALGVAYLAQVGLSGRLSAVTLMAACILLFGPAYVVALRFVTPGLARRLSSYARELAAPLRGRTQ
jgi:O-antigen/teichoic acid export membrane protein